MFEPWVLAMIEEKGHMDTNEDHINKLADYLSKSANEIIDTSIFLQACSTCNLDPASFSKNDFELLQQKLNK